MNGQQLDSHAKKYRAYRDFPCLAEKELVDKCFNRTGYNRPLCGIQIDNYQTCKSFWGRVEKERRRAHVSPAKPDAEEREKIMHYFKQHKKIPDFQNTSWHNPN